MRLQTKIVFTNLAVFIISLLFIGVLIFSNSKTIIETQVQNQLRSISQITENNINTFLDSQEEKIKLVATQDTLTNDELKKMVSEDPSIYDMFVINSTGIVIASSNLDRIGLDRSNRSYFYNARNQTFVSSVYLALVPNEYSISVSTPFHDGVLVGATKLSYFNKFISNRTGLGKTGEAFLAFTDENGSAVYFTDRLFSDKKIEVFSKERVAGLAMSYALNGIEEVFSNIKDYRGVNVLAVTNHIERVNIGLVTKTDISETFSEVNRLRDITLFLLTIIIFLTGFAVYISTKQISREIRGLTQDVDSITRGKLDMQLEKSSVFELSELINSLNRILASMKLAILRTGLSKEQLGIGEVVKAKEEAEEKYKVLYESSSDAIMTLEPPTWKFTAGNPSAIKMFGAKNEEQFKEHGPWDVAPKKQPDGSLSDVKSKKMIGKAMKEGSAFFEWTHMTINGKEFPATVLLTRVKEGERTYLQATVRDISEQKVVEQTREKLSAIVENSDDAIIGKSLEGTITSWNRAAEKLYGYSEKEIVGQPIFKIVPKRLHGEVRTILNKIKYGKKINHYETTRLRKDGKEINVSISISPIKIDGKIIGASVITRAVNNKNKNERGEE